MYSIRVEAHFSSAHNLKGYKGKCESLHGHNWKVEVVVSQGSPGKDGMVMDFTILKTKLKRILERLDHRYLNEIPYFKKINPTSENIAKYIFDVLKKGIPRLSAVTVWESENSAATYYGE